MSIIQCT